MVTAFVQSGNEQRTTGVSVDVAGALVLVVVGRHAVACVDAPRVARQFVDALHRREPLRELNSVQLDHS